MTPSHDIIIYVAQCEAFVGRAYPDGANLAAGFGLNDPDLRLGDTIDFDTAARDLVARLERKAETVSRMLGSKEVKQHEFDALLGLYDNAGTGPVQDVIARLPDRNEAMAVMTSYNRIKSGPKKGQFNIGLAKRRWLDCMIFDRAAYTLRDQLDGFTEPGLIKCWDGDPHTTQMYLQPFPKEVLPAS